MWLTPTVAHMSMVLFGRVFAIVPSVGPDSLAMCFALAGIWGLIYSCLIAFKLGQWAINHSDRFWPRFLLSVIWQ